MVRDLRRSAERNPGYPAILFVQQGTVEQGQAWFAETWPEARAIADTDHRLAQLFGVERGSLRQLASLGAIGCAVRAAAKGNRGGLVVGDSKLMPGLFAFDGDRLIWQHDFRNVGDHPDFDAIPGLIAGSSSATI
jgi:hypothetical protein